MIKQMISPFLVCVLFTGCYSVKRSVQNAQPYSSEIRWPSDYQPGDADFYIHSKIHIDAKPAVVWNLLIKAEEWPNWYKGMKNVEILNSESDVIKDSTLLKFSTMGRSFQGEIREFVVNERLAWETVNDNLNAYHAWLILPTENGCLLITDEVQKGKLAKLQKALLPNKLRKLHDVWLAEFKRKSESPTN